MTLLTRARKAGAGAQRLATDALQTRRGRRFYGQWIGASSLCFDVGANVGQRTRMFLSLGARVVAVEPQPDCVAALRRLTSSNLVIEETALGATHGTAKMKVATASGISSLANGWVESVRASGRFAEHDWPTTIEVTVSTLDALIARHGEPDFCKIDVEGYEAEVLKGLSKPVRLLSFEFTPEWSGSAEEVISLLEALGFTKFNFSSGESFRLAWDDWRASGELRKYLAALPRDGRFFGDIYAAASAST